MRVFWVEKYSPSYRAPQNLKNFVGDLKEGVPGSTRRGSFGECKTRVIDMRHPALRAPLWPEGNFYPYPPAVPPYPFPQERGMKNTPSKDGVDDFSIIIEKSLSHPCVMQRWMVGYVGLEPTTKAL